MKINILKLKEKLTAKKLIDCLKIPVSQEGAHCICFFVVLIESAFKRIKTIILMYFYRKAIIE